MKRKLTPGMRDQQRAIAKAKRRRALALRLHKRGLNAREVGDRLGVTRQRAEQMIAKAKEDLA